jgi:hypothetical protein
MSLSAGLPLLCFAELLAAVEEKNVFLHNTIMFFLSTCLTIPIYLSYI